MRLRTLFRRMAAWVLWTFVLLLVLLVGLLIVQPTLPLGALTPRMERAIERSLGRPVELSNVRFTFSLHPRLYVESACLKGVAADDVDTASASAIYVRVSLPAILLGVVRVEDASVDEVHVQVSRTSSRSSIEEGRPVSSSTREPTRFPTIDVESVRIGRVEIATGKDVDPSAVVILSDLEVTAPRNRSTQMSFQVEWHGQEAVVRAVGGELNNLLRGAALWPLWVEARSESGSAELKALWKTGHPLNIDIDGEWLDVPFLLDAKVSSLEAWPPEGPVQMDVRAEGAGAHLAASGQWQFAADIRDTLHVEANLEGERVGDLAPWLDLAPDADLPYRLTGAYRVDTHTASLEIGEAYVGQTRLTAGAARPAGGGQRIELTFDRLDLAELDTLSAGPTAEVVPSDGQDEDSRPTLRLDVPLLPSGMRLPDAEIVLKIHKLTGIRDEITDVYADLHLRDGWLERSPFGMTVASAQWTGECFLDAREAVPVFGIEVAGRDVAVHEFLPAKAREGAPKIHAAWMHAGLETQGTTLREMLSSNTLAMYAKEATVSLSRPNGQESLNLRIPSFEIKRPHVNEDAAVEVALRVDDRDVRVACRVSALTKTPKKGFHFPLSGVLTTEGTRFTWEGEWGLPFPALDLDFLVDIETDDPAWLTDLVSLGWSPIGTLHGSSRIKGRDGNYAFEDLDVTLNRSRFRGSGMLDAGSDDITWRIGGRSPEFWIDDLGMGTKTNPADPTVTNAVDPAVADATPAADEGRSIRGELALEVDNVVFDGEPLGRGEIGLRITPDRIVIDPLSIAGTTTCASVFLEKARAGSDEDGRIALSVTATNLPFAILGLFIHQLTEAEGRMYADIDIGAEPPAGESLISHLNGHIGLAAFPENIRSKYLDLWAVGPIQALGMTLRGSSDSKVECIAGRLQITDGVARPRSLYIDTARMRVKATGWMDFNRRRMHMKLKPRPKGMAFINLATPVEIKGKMSDPDIKVTTKGLAATVVRVYFWFVTAIDSMFKKKIPEHDFDGYMKMMRGKKP